MINFDLELTNMKEKLDDIKKHYQLKDKNGNIMDIEDINFNGNYIVVKLCNHESGTFSTALKSFREDSHCNDFDNYKLIEKIRNRQ